MPRLRYGQYLKIIFITNNLSTTGFNCIAYIRFLYGVKFFDVFHVFFLHYEGWNYEKDVFFKLVQ